MIENRSLSEPHHHAFFVEGTDSTDERGSKQLAALWCYLAAACGDAAAPSVHGFSKNQIELMAPTSDPKGLAKLPLDRLIARRHSDERFHRLMIAFDRIPKNTKLPYDSMRLEINWVLERMVERAILPQPFLDDAGKLLRWYQDSACPSRAERLKPRLSIEFIYMDPM